MKRFFTVLVLSCVAAAAFAQQRAPLDAALGNAVSLTQRLPRNASILALKLGAPSEALSDYASDIFTARLLASRAFTLKNRLIFSSLDKTTERIEYHTYHILKYYSIRFGAVSEYPETRNRTPPTELRLARKKGRYVRREELKTRKSEVR
ncbi:MAG: hypothetical protein LBB48_02975 [Treponema sp.]|jgi:hypothetical protein|nr:hypothetical protein [Treponema sp.]